MNFVSNEQLNQWLEEQALVWEKWTAENGQDTGWPSYYRGLKNLDSQNGFTLSSASATDFYHGGQSPLSLYLKQMDLEKNYNISGFTGYAIYEKKDYERVKI